MKDFPAQESLIVRLRITKLVLKNNKISYKDYENVPQIWDKFEMKTTKDYHDLYLFYGQLVCLKNLEKEAQKFTGYAQVII